MLTLQNRDAVQLLRIGAIPLILVFVLLATGCTPATPEPTDAPDPTDAVDSADDPTEAPDDEPTDDPTDASPDEEPSVPADEAMSVEDMVAGLDGLPLDAFFAESYDLILLRSPQMISDLGIAARYDMRNDQLDDRSIEYQMETIALKAAILDHLRTYDRESLTSDEQTSYDVYEWWLVKEVAAADYFYHDNPVNYFLNGYPDELFRLFTETHPLNSKADAEDYVARLERTGRQIDQMNANLTERTARGLIAPDFVLQQTSGRMLGDLGGSRSASADDIALYTHFREVLPRIDGLSADERDTLLASAETAIDESFIPAYLALLESVDAAEDQADGDPGLWKLEDGDVFYEHLLLEQTSTDLTPQEIHDLGQREVERIHAELDAAFSNLGYDLDNDLDSLFGQAAQDAGFVTGEAAIIAVNEGYYDKIDAELSRYFDVSPGVDLIVVPDQFGGFYVPPSLDGSRPGAFHAGTTRPQPNFIMPTIAYHEGIPGHHFQIGIAGGADLPLFRNVLAYNGYVEGWALYAERVAWELGMYDDDPYGNIGRLQLELLRAVRLVTDTGIHSLGWSRSEARDYMREAMGNDWIHEVERYTVYPAQATGYMVGMLTILDLRARAEQALGDDFDIVAFHNVLLTNGSVPLVLLDDIVDEWIAAQ